MSESVYFRAFKESVINPVSSREAMVSYNLAALAGIREDEKRQAFELLRETVADSDDPRVVDALLELRLDEGTKLVQEIVLEGAGYRTLRAAMRWWELRRSPESIDAIKRCVASSNVDLQSLSLKVLSRLEGAPNDLLFQCLYSPEFTLRQQAKEALLFKYKLDKFDNLISSPIYHLALGVTSSFEVLYLDSAKSLEEMIRAINSGKESLKSLGLFTTDFGVSDGVQAIWDAVEQSAQPIDFGLLKTLTNDELDYITEYLSRALERDDRRVVPLLKKLNTPRAQLTLSCVTDTQS